MMKLDKGAIFSEVVANVACFFKIDTMVVTKIKAKDNFYRYRTMTVHDDNDAFIPLARNAIENLVKEAGGYNENI